MIYLIVKKKKRFRVVKYIPNGMMVKTMGAVSMAFRPYRSERVPINGTNTSEPVPMICTYHSLLYYSQYNVTLDRVLSCMDTILRDNNPFFKIKYVS